MRIFRFLTFAGILIFACGIARADNPANLTVHFDPGNSTKAAGSSFTINILADVPEPGLVDFGFNLLWDPNLMQLTDVSGGGGPFDILWDSGVPESITGLLFPTGDSPASEVGWNISLATLNFTCLKEGTSGLGIILDPATDALFRGFYDLNGAPMDFTFTEGSVTQGPSVVPEPCTFVLLSAGLTGLAYWKKRKRI